MKEKLLALMQNEGLRSSQLAEMLEINPAGISHILAGRNKPGFDLLQKILSRFPRINPDWLLLDAPNMYREEQNPAAPSAQQGPAATAAGAGDLFTSAANTPDHAARENNPAAQPSVASQAADARAEARHHAAPISRIVIFYEDRTFESFTPENAIK